MQKNLKLKVLLILGLTLASIYFAFPLEKRINLGLDLKGGMDLVLRVEIEKLPEKVREDAVLRAMEILRNRIDGLGVGETVIQRQGIDQIIVQLPGITDRETAKRIIGTTAQLEFKLVSDDAQKLKDALAGNLPSGHTLKAVKDEKEEKILLEDVTVMSGEAIADARVDFNQDGFGEPRITLNLNSKGAKDFADITQKNTGRRLAIVLDGEVLSAPNIREPILSGQAEISGTFTFEEASLLALALRSGALPATIVVEEERTIGPLLGKDSIAAGINASIIGGGLVLVFMGIYYLTSGMVANIALILNILFLLGSMGFLNMMMPEAQATLTLPGIAGIILTIGMAVDANVLINERIREEITNGRPLHAAINNGYNKAFSAILDSNLTTLIAAFMLFQFGSGPIKGFSVTLTMGLLISMFTAIVVTKTIFELLLQSKLIKTLPMLQFFKLTHIDFIGKRRFFYILSILLIAVGLTNMYLKRGTMYGIDFAGGQVQEYRFTQPIDAEEVRRHLHEGGVEDVVIQQVEKSPETVILRSSEETDEKVTRIFQEKMPDNPYEVMRIEKVGPIVGKALRERALMAMTLALGVILVYVGFRFKHFEFATAGVIALLHDVVVAAVVLIMMGRQIDLLVVTALLTIAGYSINDTIVIYDRIRENMLKLKKANLAEIINISVNQTLSRTILTTSVTMIVVIILFLKGGEVLNNFALCLLIGFISGTYSTIFIASPLVLAWQKKIK